MTLMRLACVAAVLLVANVESFVVPVGGSAVASFKPRHAKSCLCARDGGIDLDKAMKNARQNLADGESPGAGLDSAFDQADAAYADLLLTSLDGQGLTVDEKDVQELSEAGMMDAESTSKKSKGLFGDIGQALGALAGGAHIVRGPDGKVRVDPIRGGGRGL